MFIFQNPTALFPGVVHSGTATRSAAQLDDHTRESVSTAGLHCLSYHRYKSRWVFRRMEDYLGEFNKKHKTNKYWSEIFVHFFASDVLK